MARLEYFRRNKKSKTETVTIRKPSSEQILFTEFILDVLSPKLERFGFKRHRTEIVEQISTITFRKNQQYIKVSGSTYSTDYPYHYNIILGEGDSKNFLEWDWNSVAVWRIKPKIDSAIQAKEFSFPNGNSADILKSINNASDELFKYGDSFLQGDLSLFYEVRNEQNKDR